LPIFAAFHYIYTQQALGSRFGGVDGWALLDRRRQKLVTVPAVQYRSYTEYYTE